MKQIENENMKVTYTEEGIKNLMRKLAENESKNENSFQDLPKALKSIEIDLENGKYLLNGKPLKNVDEFILEYKNAEWILSMRQYLSKKYSATGKAASVDTAKEIKE